MARLTPVDQSERMTGFQRSPTRTGEAALEGLEEKSEDTPSQHSSTTLGRPPSPAGTLSARGGSTGRSVPNAGFNSDDKEEEEERVPRTAQNQSVLNKMWTLFQKIPRFIRYIFYMIPVALILSIPIVLSISGFDDVEVGGTGGVTLLWFGIWLEVTWLTLWAARIVSAPLPYTFRILASMFGASNSKDWKTIGRRFEFPSALFLWTLSLYISLQPILDNDRAEDAGELTDIGWVSAVQNVIIAIFVLATLILVAKVCMIWIIASFHKRTYSRRIEDQNIAVAYLVKLYEYAKTQIGPDDNIWNATKGRRNSIGQAVGRVAGDITGRKFDSKNPRKVVLQMLKTTESSLALARIIFGALREGRSEIVTLEDLEGAFKQNLKDAKDCLKLLDRDLNGDLTLGQLEASCDEIHREKKAISASLKDIGSVMKKLEIVLIFISMCIALIVFLNIISDSVATALASFGTIVLALSWVLQTTAEDFLESVVFILIKHPYDVGDRVTIYGETGSDLTGDDYYVTEITLLSTSFKKMEGHIVQAPNSVLNGLFILNQRRSGPLADIVPLVIRFGTSEHLIEELKERMLDFTMANKREYDTWILIEIVSIDELYSFTMNFIFFHKSSYQDELIRLSRHDRFLTRLMYEMHRLGIEGPRRQQPGGNPEYPVYWTQIAAPAYQSSEAQIQDPAVAEPAVPMVLPHLGRNFQDVFESRSGHSSSHRAPSTTSQRGGEPEPLPERVEELEYPIRSHPASYPGSRRRFFGGRHKNNGPEASSV